MDEYNNDALYLRCKELLKENEDLKQKISELNLVIGRIGVENQLYRMKLEDATKTMKSEA